jgi:hypothetical protein
MHATLKAAAIMIYSRFARKSLYESYDRKNDSALLSIIMTDEGFRVVSSGPALFCASPLEIWFY